MIGIKPAPGDQEYISKKVGAIPSEPNSPIKYTNNFYLLKWMLRVNLE